MVGHSFATWRSLGLMLAIAAAVGYGLHLRLQDPLSSPVIAAEDPYTHMALVREHLRDGTINPLNSGSDTYPPGMHALLAATIAFTGVGLYDLARVGPAFFGALGLAGIGLLLARFEGAPAAIAGVLAAAIVPEMIFRTTMLSPTSLDLALLPFFSVAVLETLQGRLGWAAAAGALAGFMLMAHPWVFGIIGVAGLALILLSTVLPWPERHGPAMDAWGLVAVVAIVGLGIGLGLNGCWGGCGPGFREVLGPGSSGTTSMLANVVIVIALIPLLAKAVSPKAFEAFLPHRRPAPSLALRLVCSNVLLVGIVVTVFLASKQGMPPFVNLPRMIGWPLLLLGGFGVIALPFRPSPAGHLGAALALSTLPFVLFNPFHSEFWSHRTAVYFAVGVCILVGVAFAVLVQLGTALASKLPAAASATAVKVAGQPPAAAAPRKLTPLLALSGLLVLVCLGGGVYAATPAQYEGGWYRLYTPCEYAGLNAIANQANASPGLLVITGDWQAKLVIGGLTNDNSRLWYKPDFYNDATERGNVVQMLEEQGRPIVVLVDSNLGTPNNVPVEAGFLASSPWTPIGSWCPGSGPDGSSPALTAYTLES
jgi:hypothetical protein